MICFFILGLEKKRIKASASALSVVDSSSAFVMMAQAVYICLIVIEEGSEFTGSSEEMCLVRYFKFGEIFFVDFVPLVGGTKSTLYLTSPVCRKKGKQR